MLDVPENLCVTLLTVTSPNAAAADILLTPSPPKKIDRRAAAAGQNHPARRRRNTDVGAGLYIVVVRIEKLLCDPLNNVISNDLERPSEVIQVPQLYIRGQCVATGKTLHRKHRDVVSVAG